MTGSERTERMCEMSQSSENSLFPVKTMERHTVKCLWVEQKVVNMVHNSASQFIHSQI